MLSSPDTKLIWEVATGYDFFTSIHVLHKPTEFGLRGAWAKGVRSRLPGKFRTFFEETAEFYLAAVEWVNQLPEPKDAATLLNAMQQIPAQERFLTLLRSESFPPLVNQILDQVAAKQAWTEAERDRLIQLSKEEGHPMTPAYTEKMLDSWAKGYEYGELILEALKTYFDVFFAEEEERIRPALERAVAEAQEKAAQLPLDELFVELSEGWRFGERAMRPEFVMIPSFWIAPLVMLNPVSDQRAIFLFGGRPDDASLVPGEVVPDALFRALKALADPTRLRVLRYLEESPLTPTELAKKLRLRAPTVIHHLNNLRLAGLVIITWDQGDKRYAARMTRVDEMYGQLRRYLVQQDESAATGETQDSEQPLRMA